MVEITKHYATKFPREVIEEALNVFQKNLIDEDKISYKILDITVDNTNINLEFEEEFYSEYRKKVNSASLSYVYRDNIRFRVAFSSNSTSVTISLKSRSDAENVLNIFDKNYSAPLMQDIRDVHIEIPSCNVGKDLLLELEEYIKSISDLIETDKYKLVIQDASGSEELNSVNAQRNSYFDDNTEKIQILCGSYDNKIEISFSPSRGSSWIQAKLISSTAREDIGAIVGSLLRIINNYKTNNYIYHNYIIGFLSIFFFFIFLSIIISGLLVVGLSMFNDKLAVGIILILLGIIIYGIFNYINPYCTIKTRKNERHSKWHNWFIFATLEFLIFTVMVGLILKQTGIV
jgi:hypothetical protein